MKSKKAFAVYDEVFLYLTQVLTLNTLITYHVPSYYRAALILSRSLDVPLRQNAPPRCVIVAQGSKSPSDRETLTQIQK